jgi:hypothetical protein
MKKLRLVCLLAALAAGASLSPARAQGLVQEYASPSGGGNCSANAPCDLLSAMSAAGAGGFVSCINGGVYIQSTTVSTSLTIDCPGGLVSPFFGAALVLNGTSSQVVILRNLTFDGGGQNFGFAPLIQVTGGATLIIENCKFQNTATGNAIAIQYQPNSPAAQLIIRDSTFANNGIAPGTGGGIQVAPAAGGSASVRLERVSFDFNVTSLVLSGPVNATMIGSVVQASRNTGILVGSGSTLVIEDSKLVYNVGSAVSVAGGGTLRLSNDTIESNQVGISNSGGQALSYKNNRIVANGSTATLGTIAGGQ